MWLLLPIGSDRAVFGMPWFTILVGAACIVLQLAAFTGLIDPVALLGFVPAGGPTVTLLTYAFAHGGLFHLVGNMFFLWCMGIHLEYRWGWPTFAALYLVGAVVAAMSFGSLHGGSAIPLVGASGAISAAMGAFLVTHLKSRIRFWYAYFLFVKGGTGTFQIPSYVVLPFWFISDLLGARSEVASDAGVAYSAHVGGFVFGALVALGLKLSGIDKRLLDQTGADVSDDLASHLQAPQAPSTVPPPNKCASCGLVNMGDASNCRRCGAGLLAR